jgi:hypothetical protein
VAEAPEVGDGDVELRGGVLEPHVEHATDDSPFRGVHPAAYSSSRRPWWWYAVESLIERRVYWPGLYSTNKG